MNAYSIASRCINRLFVNGAGQSADRLALMSKDGKDLGGWCVSSMSDIIESEVMREIKGDRARATRKAKRLKAKLAK